jgi:hypothetical protein
MLTGKSDVLNSVCAPPLGGQPLSFLTEACDGPEAWDESESPEDSDDEDSKSESEFLNELTEELEDEELRGSGGSVDIDR